MGKRFGAKIPPHQITPPSMFLERRKFLASLGIGVSAIPTLFCSTRQDQSGRTPIEVPFQRPDTFPPKKNPTFSNAPVPGELTPREVAATHNNFYEFLPGQGGPVWRYTEKFQVEPWKVEVIGDCENPVTLDLDDLFRFEHEERVYHFRCVERWAMNVPWSGFPLSKLIEQAQPKDSARFVRFISAYKPDQMPGVREANYYPWPYNESLRLDEAMNELVLVATGIYGEPLLKQHGAPVRIVVPWKYGYKNPKSIVKIEFLSRQPKNFWEIQEHEYGFLSNVNPNIPHPRWSQERSHWIDSRREFPTPIFNGYEQYVAELYPDEPRTPQSPLRPGQRAR